MRLSLRSKKAPGRYNRRLIALGGTIGVLFFFWFAPRPVQADSLKGHMDLIYSRTNQASTDTMGNETNTENRAFIQLYSLAADKDLWPNLRLFASGVLQRTDADSVTNGERTSGSTTMTRPFIDLTWRSFPFTAGVNYSKVTTEAKSFGAPKSVLISEAYNGFLGWKPADLPTLDVYLSRTKNYDRDRAQFNTVSDRVGVNSSYQPVSTVQLRYYGNYGDQKDLKNETETRIVGHDGKVDYSDRFFHDRVTFSASEEIALSTIEARTTGAQANISFQVFAVKGLSLNTYDVQGLSRVPLADAPFLIDNTVNGPRNDANNIGASPTLDTTPRNMGLQFAVASEVNILDVWVYSVHDTRNPDTTQDFLPDTVAALFQWAVYTSTDGISWSLYQSGAPAGYTPFPSQLGVGKFEITFPPVTAQYIKVVVTPLLPSLGTEAASFPGVYITELQAFSSVSAQKAQGKHSSTVQTTNVATKVSILENPYLFYDFSYFEVQSEAFSTTMRNSTMSNGLTFSQQFSRIFSGSASVQRLDAKTSLPNGDMVTYQFSTSVQAVPLRTLRHSLSFSDSVRETHTGRSTSQSWYLTNTAELYRNVSVYLNGGQTWLTDEMDKRTASLQYSYGGSVVPIKTLVITGSSTYTKSDGYFARADTLGVAYNPLATLYLNASWGTTADSSRRNTLQSYNAIWSPFPGGALQLSVTYTESLQTQDNSTLQALTESVRWNINRATAVQAGYEDSKNTSDIGRTTARIFSAQLSVSL